MKKVMFLVILALFATINIDAQSVSANDPQASIMGFDVDEDQYGQNKYFTYVESYAYYNSPYNNKNYQVGFQRLRVAVFEDQYSDMMALVIVQGTVQPLDATVPHMNFGWDITYNSHAEYQRVYSDVDSFYNAYYGIMNSSSGFVMDQASPREEISSTKYTAGIEVGPETKVSGSITFDSSEFYITNEHNAAYNIFDVKFNYKCDWFDCSYKNSLTYNKATFLVEMSGGTTGRYYHFINELMLTTKFGNGSSYILPDVSASTTVVSYYD